MPESTEPRDKVGVGGRILIHIWVHTIEPVGGEAGVDGRAPIRFEGWLDLLERLSDSYPEPVAGPRNSGEAGTAS